MTAPDPEASATSAWQHFPHDADIGVRGLGATREAAFEQAALALTAVVTDPARVEPRKPVDFACAASDEELLLVEWLNELIYAMATRRMLFGRFAVRLDDHHRLTARAWGEPVDVARHQPAAEVKGATYTALAVGRTSEGDWIAECVVDV